jgi:hypothetical protein
MPQDAKPSCAGGILVLLLGGTLLAGACCFGPAVLSPFFWIAEEAPPDRLSIKPAADGGDADKREAPAVLPAPKGEAPPPTPQPPGPEPPIRVSFDEGGVFVRETLLDPDDPDPRGVFPCCRRFVVNAQADTAYHVEIDGPRDFRVRVEATSGGPPIEPKDASGKHSQVVFVAEKTQAYVVFVLGTLADFNRSFTMRVRVCDDRQPLPEEHKIATNAVLPVLEIAQQLKGKLLVGGAFARDGKTFWTANHEMGLERWSASGARIGGYKLKKRLYALAVDRRGRLYAQPGMPAVNAPGVAPRTISDIEVYDTLNPKGDVDELPLPSRTLLVRGLVPRLIPSADGRWIYFLDVLGGKVGRIDTDAGTVDRVVSELSAGTLAFCLRPDGTKIYTCSAQGSIDVIDVESFAIERTVALQRGKPYDIAATDRGMIFILGHEFGAAAPNTAAVADLSREGVDTVHAVPLPCRHYGQYLLVDPEQRAVLIAGDHKISVCTVPRRPAWEQVLSRELRVSETGTPGWMQISPDGHTILHDAGAILSLHR